MQKIVLKPGDVIPEKAVFDSVNVTGESELLGIVVYVPEPIVNPPDLPNKTPSMFSEEPKP